MNWKTMTTAQFLFSSFEKNQLKRIFNKCFLTYCGEFQDGLGNFTCLQLGLYEICFKIYLNFAMLEKRKKFFFD